jgi:hypothetical protein
METSKLKKMAVDRSVLAHFGSFLPCILFTSEQISGNNPQCFICKKVNRLYRLTSIFFLPSMHVGEGSGIQNRYLLKEPLAHN